MADNEQQFTDLYTGIRQCKTITQKLKHPLSKLLENKADKKTLTEKFVCFSDLLFPYRGNLKYMFIVSLNCLHFLSVRLGLIMKSKWREERMEKKT